MPHIEQKPFTIHIYVPDGDPDGLRIIQKSNWTGEAVVFKRSGFKKAIQRKEVEYTGVYILVGPSENSSLPTVYIGEADSIITRLRSHYANKDFWEWAVFFVTKDESLNRAHAKFIESRLIELATSAKQCNLDNSQNSKNPNLTEWEISDVENFLAEIMNILPLLGLSVFEKTDPVKDFEELLHLNVKEIQATGFEDPKGFVVCAGSHMTKEESRHIHNYMSTMRKDLLDQNIIKVSDDFFVFVEDHVFGSPSTAAGVIVGAAINGRTAWKNKDGVTLKEIQTEAAKDS